MILPDLGKYRLNFAGKGTKLPLDVVTNYEHGLLNELPKPGNSKTGWPWTEQTDPKTYQSGKVWPKLTIVTPSYNQGVFLEETIRSVLLQNYPNLEYIVIDGGSTDNSKEILEKYSPWLSYWQSEKDNGQAHAINLGFSLAGGQYYAWVNSDDYYVKDAFYTVSQTFSKTQVDFIYGYVFNYMVQQKNLELIKVPPLLDYFIKIPSLAQPACFWSADIHQPLWEEMNCALDYELWLRLVKGNKRKRIKQPLAITQIHGNAKTSDPNMKEKWHEDHVKMWSVDGHGPVPEWNRIVFLHRIIMKVYKILHLL